MKVEMNNNNFNEGFVHNLQKELQI